jgi:hypothetical protein
MKSKSAARGNEKTAIAWRRRTILALLQEGQTAYGQAYLVNFAICDQAFQVGFQSRQFSLEVRAEAHQIASSLNSLDRLLENIDLGTHKNSRFAAKRTRNLLVPSSLDQLGRLSRRWRVVVVTHVWLSVAAFFVDQHKAAVRRAGKRIMITACERPA